MTPTKTLLVTVAAIAIVGVGAYVLLHPSAPTNPGSTASSTGQTTATSTTSTSTTATSTNPGTGLTLAQPDYKKPIAFAANITPDIRTQLNAQLAKVQADVAKNPLSIHDWVVLGNLHKIGGDYKNAALYWEYVTSIYAGTGAPYLSLGDLYQNFLPNLTKAEANYLMAIKVDSHNVNAYADLFTLYHYQLKNDTKAAAILTQGLTANPSNNYLLGLQSDLTSSTTAQ